MSYDIYHSPDAADGLTATEAQLAELIEEYRAANGLPAVRLSYSLSLVAARHDEDIIYNLNGYFPGDPGTNSGHSWSDAPYNALNSATYTAIWEAPQRLHTSYPGYGFEILVGYTGSSTALLNITPQTSLAGWKSSPGHNAVILNQSPWDRSDLTWNAMGIGMQNGVASVWFGHETDPAGSPNIYLLGNYSQYTVTVGAASIEVDDIGNTGDPNFVVPNANDLVFKDGVYHTNTGSFVSTVAVRPYDFNGDGVSDILWRHSSGTVATWLIDNAKVQTSLGGGGAATSWKIIDTGDFNGDGTADILWRDSSSGTIAIWQMHNGQVQSSVGVGSAPSNWHIVATGDFDGDGKSDLLWRDANTGTLAVWEMNGGAVTASIGVGNVASAWQVVGAGDFNGDGKADILFRNTTSGTAAIWNMNGGQVQSSVGLGDVGLTWNIAGIGDFNGDGTVDLLWRDGNSGTVAVWQIKNGQVTASTGVGSAPANWEIDGTGDYNHDGKSDILWRDNTSGTVAAWELNGGSIIASVGLGAADSSWTIVHHDPIAAMTM